MIKKVEHVALIVTDICCKLIRILFIVGKKQIEFNPEKMMRDIPHFGLQLAA